MLVRRPGVLCLVGCWFNHVVSLITLGSVGLLELGLVVCVWFFILSGYSVFSLNT